MRRLSRESLVTDLTFVLARISQFFWTYFIQRKINKLTVTSRLSTSISALSPLTVFISIVGIFGRNLVRNFHK